MNKDRIREALRPTEDHFSKSYEDYVKQLEILTGGLVEPSKADFAKMTAFYYSVIAKDLNDIVNNINEHLKQLT